MMEHISRRRYLECTGAGFGMLAFRSLLAEQGLLLSDSETSVDSLSPRRPPLEAKAKSVIFLFMSGGPSHSKRLIPSLTFNDFTAKSFQHHSDGQDATCSRQEQTAGHEADFQEHGESGIEVSDLLRM